MKKLQHLTPFDIDRDGNNDNFWVLLDKINELVGEVNRLGMVNLPITDLDDPTNNCRACDHVHQTCKCGCNAS